MQAWILWSANTGNFWKQTVCHLGETHMYLQTNNAKTHTVLQQIESWQTSQRLSTTDLNIGQLLTTYQQTSIWLLCIKPRPHFAVFTSSVTIAAISDQEVGSKFTGSCLRTHAHPDEFSSGIFCISHAHIQALASTHAHTRKHIYFINL